MTTANINVIKSTLEDRSPYRAGVVDRYDADLGWLVFRGLEAGPGITLKVQDADNDTFTTKQKKIVISALPVAGGGADGVNLGTGAGVFSDNTGGLLRFRSLTAGENVTITTVGDEIRISAGANATTGRNLGTAGPTLAGVYAGKVGNEMQFRRIVGGCGVKVTEHAETVVIEGEASNAVTGASNLGTGGLGVFKQKTANTLEFRTLAAGPNIVLTEDGNRIYIESVADPVQGSNRGTSGAEVFASKVGGTLSFRRLRAGQNVSLNQTIDAIEISAVTTGTYNVGASKGTPDDGGHEIYAGMDGDTLLFKKLYAGPNITMVENDCGIMIAAGLPAGTDGGEANDGINLGTGHAVFAGKQDTFLKFKTLVPGPGASLSETADEIMVSAQTDASNLGPGIGLFENRDGSVLYFRSLVEGRGIKIDQDADTVTLSLAGSAAGRLGDLPGGASYDDPIAPGCPEPAATGWTADTPVNEALAELNRILGVLLPPKPPALRTKTLDLTGYTLVPLAADVPDNTAGKGPTAGQTIRRITRLPAVSTTVTDFRAGESGTLQAILNCNVVGEVALTRGDDAGTYGSLEVLGDAPYPTDGGSACLWQALTARISGNVPAGVNFYQLSHSQSGETNRVFFWYDPITVADPALSGFLVNHGSQPFTYSSSVPHYASGGTVLASMTANGLGTVEIEGEAAIGSLVTLSPGDAGIPNPPEEPQVITDAPFTIGGNIHTTTRLRARVRNTIGDSPYSVATKWINVMSGIASPQFTPLQEMAIPVTDLGTTPADASLHATRVVMDGGDTPSDDVSALLVGDWNSESALRAWDAAIVGGVLRADLTNYTSGYLPAGPDLSGRDTDQYVTFLIRRSAASSMFIHIQGTYSGCWVKLPGLDPADIPNAPGGWFDAFTLYDGVGMPGGPGNGNGCALPNGQAPAVMGGASGVFRVTFGPTSSTYSTNNIILVRLKLSGTNAVTGLAFKGTP